MGNILDILKSKEFLLIAISVVKIVIKYKKS